MPLAEEFHSSIISSHAAGESSTDTSLTDVSTACMVKCILVAGVGDMAVSKVITAL